MIDVTSGRTILLSFVCAGMLSTCDTMAPAQEFAIAADPGVTIVSFDTFDGLGPTALWHALDEEEFWAVPRVAPAGFYDSVNASSSALLRQSLHALIEHHTVFAYTHSSRPGDSSHTIDTWDIIAIADQHPALDEHVLDVYLNGTFPRQTGGPPRSFRYDREHVWPKSRGFPDQDTDNPAFSDCHHLMASYNRYNNDRNNRAFGDVPFAFEFRRVTVENIQGGGSHVESKPEQTNLRSDDLWEVWDGRRGDIARACFYMDVRYEGGTNEADLQLTDSLASIADVNVWESGGVAFMGLKEVLLQWHEDDPVDDFERRRNTVVSLFQGNRNPFVDHPEWVDVLFGDGGAVPSPAPPAPIASGGAWINELHYDNASGDVGEFVEVAAGAGVSLSGWHLVCYNGSNSLVYDTIDLDGVVVEIANGIGVLAFDVPGLQNGSPDAIALVDALGDVVDFVSYEGVLTAADGPAVGMVSSAITTAETNTTPVGHSLQRTGTGSSAVEFVWAEAQGSTRGLLNVGQGFDVPRR